MEDRWCMVGCGMQFAKIGFSVGAERGYGGPAGGLIFEAVWFAQLDEVREMTSSSVPLQ